MNVFRIASVLVTACLGTVATPGALGSGKWSEAGSDFSSAAGNAWEATKEASAQVWDKTKEVSSDAWEGVAGEGGTAADGGIPDVQEGPSAGDAAEPVVTPAP